MTAEENAAVASPVAGGSRGNQLRSRSLLGSLRLKVLLIGSVGVLLPFAAVFSWAGRLSQDAGRALVIITATVTFATLILILAALSRLIDPVLATAAALRRYAAEGKLPSLPVDRPGETGLLMADAQHTMEALHRTVERLGLFDELTDLPNRTAFREAVAGHIEDARTAGGVLAVVIANIDGFNRIYAVHGQSAGDEVLREVSRRLRRALGVKNTLARIGPDEFGIVVLEAGSSVEALRQSTALQAAASGPVTLAETSLHVTISMGVALFPADGTDSDALMQSAAAALREEAKQRGPGSLQFSSEELNGALRHRLAMETDLRAAIERREIDVLYQPRVHLRTGAHESIEALARWHSPERGLVMPGEFVPVAEACDLIIPIGDQVLRRACRQGRIWNDAGLGPLRVAVNLSARQFRAPDLVASVSRALEESRLDPALLELEVTESVIMEQMDQAIRVLTELHDMGVQLSLDDFGTGYSSLQYLRLLPLDAMKIDRSFVQDVCSDESAAALVRSIIALGHSLGLTVVAEGVETRDQARLLKLNGCDEAQGYWFSRPVEAEAYPKWVRNRAQLRLTAA